MKVQFEKDWTSMACVKGLPGDRLLSLKRTWQHSLGLQSFIDTNYKTSGTRSFERMGPKWGCLVIMHTATSAENQTVNCQAWWWSGDDLGILCWFFSWVFLLPPDLGTFPSLSLESNVRHSFWGLKQSRDTRQWSQGQQQISNRNAEKKRFEVFQWPIQSPDLNLIESQICINESPQTWMNQSKVVEKSWSTFHSSHTENFSSSYCC